MLSKWKLGAPLYCCTGQVGPRFGELWSLEEWKWCHNVMVEADIHLNPLHTSIIHIRHIQSVWAIMLSQRHMVAPIYRYTSQIGPKFGKSGSLEVWKWCHNIMVEADVHLRLVYPSILDIYKVIDPFVCCLKRNWVHPFARHWYMWGDKLS